MKRFALEHLLILGRKVVSISGDGTDRRLPLQSVNHHVGPEHYIRARALI